jgi:hypothetical protein
MLKLHGLNDGWKIVRSWCTQEPRPAEKLVETPASYSKKCPEIVKLNDYRVAPNKGFWNNFPKNTKKISATTKVKIDTLQNLIDKCKKYWTAKDKWIANKCIKNLTFGSKIHFTKDREPFYSSKNAHSAFVHGEMITDSIANWIKKDIVIGPFDGPPCKKFCVNPLVAIIQKSKIRPILNLKVPVGSAFNKAVNENRIRKLKMCSAKIFSQTLLKAGKNSKFCKSDMADAFKLIPSHKNDWKFFGFKGLGKFFADTTNPFGSKAAPANFDDLGKTLVNIAKTLSNTPSVLINRQLDDVPVGNNSYLLDRWKSGHLRSRIAVDIT